MKNKYIWKTKDNEIISCDEKIKVLNENLNEVENLIQNVFDDALLMGCDQFDVKIKFIKIIKKIKYSFD